MNKSEQWKDFPNWEGMYRISNRGRVLSVARKVLTKDDKWLTVKERILKPRYGKSNHAQVALHHEGETTQFSLARMVLIVFKGASTPDAYAMHKDGNLANCRLSNLRWESKSKVQYEKPRKMKGTKHFNSKFTVQQIKAIRALVPTLGFGGQATVARTFGVSHVTINKIVHGQTWGHV